MEEQGRSDSGKFLKGGLVKIGFDVDGVLANFCTSYEALHVAVRGANHFAPWALSEGPVSWNWPEEYGYTPEETAEVWQAIKESSTFWMNLSTLPDFEGFKRWWETATGLLSSKEIYFISDRPGRYVKKQTELWLANHLVLETVMYSPTVLISGQKGEIAHALKLDYYVDDKAENVVDVQRKSPDTKVFLLDRAYNRHYAFAPGVRIKSLSEFLTALV
jgi:deoxypyrimidine-specific 5' nucleotidase type C protein (NT5C)